MPFDSIQSSSSSSHCCSYCGKSYTRKSSYDRHFLMCDNAYKSKRLKKCEAEESDPQRIPSISVLYNIIQELLIKQEKMEKKIEEQQKWIDRKKKKLNIVEWLNTNIIPKYIYRDFVKSIIVTEEDINCLTDCNFVLCVFNIIKKNLKTPKENPIICFSEKASVFYIYEVDTDASKWKKMTTDDLVYMLKIVHSKLLHALCSWRDNNAEKMTNSDKMAELYNRTVIKLMGSDFNQESLLTKIRAPLYNHLKENLLNTVEYEYEF